MKCSFCNFKTIIFKTTSKFLGPKGIEGKISLFERSRDYLFKLGNKDLSRRKGIDNKLSIFKSRKNIMHTHVLMCKSWRVERF